MELVGNKFKKLKQIIQKKFDRFGRSVSIHGNYIIIGAPGEDSDANGNNNNILESGSAYIFRTTNNGASWSQTQILKANNAGDNDNFGYSVSIHGSYAIVGATDERSDGTGDNDNNYIAGAAYIFRTTNNGASWSQTQMIKAETVFDYQYFGNSVSIHGNYAIVGASGRNSDGTNTNTYDSLGAAYIFRTTDNGASWSQTQMLKADNGEEGDSFGKAVSIHGDYAIISASNKGSYPDGRGAAYIFKTTNDGLSWSQKSFI